MTRALKERGTVSIAKIARGNKALDEMALSSAACSYLPQIPKTQLLILLFSCANLVASLSEATGASSNASLHHASHHHQQPPRTMLPAAITDGWHQSGNSSAAAAAATTSRPAPPSITQSSPGHTKLLLQQQHNDTSNHQSSSNNKTSTTRIPHYKVIKQIASGQPLAGYLFSATTTTTEPQPLPTTTSTTITAAVSNNKHDEIGLSAGDRLRFEHQHVKADATDRVPVGVVAGWHPLAGGTFNSSTLTSSPGKQLVGAAQQTKYKLPSWFNYDLYKRFYGKHYSSLRENEIHRRIYLRTALDVFEQRAQYRAGRSGSLASMNELSDLTSDELEMFKTRHQQAKRRLRRPQHLASPPSPASSSSLLPECCTYDQVYKRIIELLEHTSSSSQDQPAGSIPDLALSKALVEELEQKSFVSASEGSQFRSAAAAADASADDDHDDDDDYGQKATATIEPTGDGSISFARQQPQSLAAAAGGARKLDSAAASLAGAARLAPSARKQQHSYRVAEGADALARELAPSEAGSDGQAQVAFASAVSSARSRGKQQHQLVASDDNGTLLQSPMIESDTKEETWLWNSAAKRPPATKPTITASTSISPPASGVLQPVAEPHHHRRPSPQQPQQQQHRPSAGSGSLIMGEAASSSVKAPEDANKGARHASRRFLKIPAVSEAPAKTTARGGAKRAEPRRQLAVEPVVQAAGAGDTGLEPASSADDEPVIISSGPLAEDVRRQVEAQLSTDTSIGRQLQRQFSAYFGEPVVLRTAPAAAEKPVTSASHHNANHTKPMHAPRVRR